MNIVKKVLLVESQYCFSSDCFFAYKLVHSRSGLLKWA